MGKKRGDKTLTAFGGEYSSPPKNLISQRQLNIGLRIEVRNVGY
jgi:hypothetical protein